MIARRRLTFENLLMFVTAMRLNRDTAREGIPLDIAADAADRYWAGLPFPPTGAQRRALAEIAADMRGPAAMSRLVAHPYSPARRKMVRRFSPPS